MCRYLALLIVASQFGFAPAPVFNPRSDPSVLDLARLQGSWLVAGDLEARVEKDRLTYFRDGQPVTAYRIRVNAKTDPKTLDLMGIGGDASDGSIYLMIYRLGLNSLITSSNGSKEPRPAAFTGPDAGRYVETYERKKP